MFSCETRERNTMSQLVDVIHIISQNKSARKLETS